MNGIKETERPMPEVTAQEIKHQLEKKPINKAAIPDQQAMEVIKALKHTGIE